MVADSSSTESVMGRRWTRGGVVGGVVLVLVGLVALFTPFVTGIALSIFVGVLLVVGALVHVGAAFSAGSALGVVWELVLGIIYGFVGIAVLTNPVFGLTTLTILVIAFFVAEGIIQLVWAVTGGAGSRLWLAFSGVVSLLLAAFLWADFPVSAVWAVGVLFGVNLLVTGVAMIMHGRGQRAATRTETAADASG